MIINFYPDSDNPGFDKAAKEYEKIWQEERDKIVAAIEKVSGLRFKEKVINAVTYGEISYSIPLMLQSNISIKHKRGTIVHELCHRLIVGNNIRLNVGFEDKNWNLEVHKHVDLILYDIWIELYGRDFAKKEIDYEISLWTGKDVSPYKLAWDWATKMSKEQRQKEFKKYLQK